MKVLALNSSARAGTESKTGVMLEHLVEGMREAGAEVDSFNLKELKVKDCLGCFTCWSKTPNKCIIQDDMTKELYPRWIGADLCVYATPLYHYTVNAVMKAFIERTLPHLDPFMVEGPGGNITHPARHKSPRAVIVSVAGFPEMAVFKELSHYCRFLFSMVGGVVAEIYRPAAETMMQPFLKEKAEDIFAATRQAGREIVRDGKVAGATMERVTQPLMDTRDIMLMTNAFWDTARAEGMTPKEFREKGAVPRAGSLEAFMVMMRVGYRKDKAGDLKAVMQYDFSGEVEGSCHFRFSKDGIESAAGSHPSPDLRIITPFELWQDIATGKVNPQQAMMEGKYKVEGDFSLLMRLNELFGDKD